MSTIRTDPVTGRRVIIAAERSDRPRPLRDADSTTTEPTHCPFCRGNEDTTPSPIQTFPPDDPDWDVRVVPNKYPALSTSEQLDHHADGPHQSMTGVGAHEVVVETPDHIVDLQALSVDQVATVLRAWRQRIADLANDQRLEHVLPFKNHGAPSGASLEHAHSQIIGLPVTPHQVQLELDGARRYHEDNGECVFCSLVDHNLEREDRLVHADDHVAVFAPNAARFPFELWFVPRAHQARFERADADVEHHLAAALVDILQRLDRALDSPPYNLVLHTAPLRSDDLEHFHWHLELIPTLSHIAGFEWGTGLHINCTSPEASAKHLREIELE